MNFRSSHRLSDVCPDWRDHARAEQCHDQRDRLGLRASCAASLRARRRDRNGPACCSARRSGSKAGHPRASGPAQHHEHRGCGRSSSGWHGKIATAGPVSETEPAKPVGLVGAALFQWANPKGWLVAISAAGTLFAGEAENQFAQALWFGGLLLRSGISKRLAMARPRRADAKALRDERKARVFNIAMGLALAASVVMIFR